MGRSRGVRGSRGRKSVKYQDFKVISLNINGVNETKLTFLNEYIMENDPNIVLLQESKCRSDELSIDLTIEGYNHVVTERGGDDKAGGGLVTYYKEDILAHKWEPNGNHIHELVKEERSWLMIESGVKLAICNVYVAAESSKNTGYKPWNEKLYEMLQAEINMLRDMDFNVWIMGDFNGHIGTMKGPLSKNTNKVNFNGELFNTFVNDYNFFVLNQLGGENDLITRTHETKEGEIISESCLDFAIVGDETQLTNTTFKVVEKDYLCINSDHRMIEVTTKLLRDNNVKVPKPKKYILDNKERFNKYKTSVKNILKNKSTKVFASKSASEQINYLHAIMEKCADSHLVVQKRTKNHSRKKNKNTLRLLELKRQKWQKIKQEGATEQELEEYQNIKELTTKEITKGVMEHKDAIRLELTLRDPTTKKFWKLMKRKKERKGGITALKNKEGKILFNKKDIGEAAYESLKKKLNGSEEEHVLLINIKKRKSKFSKQLSKPVSKQEFTKILSKVKNGKAKGPFGIHSEFVKQGGCLLQQFIRIWINTVLKDGKIPKFLKGGIVKLLHKRGDSLDPGSYRPITISSTLLKIITRVLNTRLSLLAEQQNWLSERQFGFRKGRSTQDGILIVSAVIEQAKADKLDAGIACVDLAQAYDSVDRKVMFKKLERLGIKGSFLTLLNDYYTNDFVKFDIGGQLTKPMYLKQGVKQGCNLSPLLFNLFLVDMIEDIHRSGLGIKINGETVSIISYADDIIIIVKHIEHLGKVIKNLTDKCKKINMNVSTSKSKIIRIGKAENEFLNDDQTY